MLSMCIYTLSLGTIKYTHNQYLKIELMFEC